MITSTDRWFAQTLMQIDVAANGNVTMIDGRHAGKLTESTFLFMSVGTGYWLTRPNEPGNWLHRPNR